MAENHTSSVLSDENSDPGTITLEPLEKRSRVYSNRSNTRSDTAVVCPRCEKRWGGYNTCHCTACHQTFTGLTAFDKHRTGSHVKDTRACLSPAEVGLVDANRGYPCWGFPGDDTYWAKRRLNSQHAETTTRRT